VEQIRKSEELEVTEATTEINQNEIVVQRSVHEIIENKGDGLQNSEKEHQLFMKNRVQNTSLVVNILQINVISMIYI
jgi:hypothetical protein